MQLEEERTDNACQGGVGISSQSHYKLNQETTSQTSIYASCFNYFYTFTIYQIVAKGEHRSVGTLWKVGGSKMEEKKIH